MRGDEAKGRRWRLLSNHGLVLAYIARDPGATLRQMAQALGLTERAVYRLVRDLEEAGLIAKQRRGRRNVYRVDWARVLTAEAGPGLRMGDWLRVMQREAQGPGPQPGMDTGGMP